MVEIEEHVLFPALSIFPDKDSVASYCYSTCLISKGRTLARDLDAKLQRTIRGSTLSLTAADIGWRYFLQTTKKIIDYLENSQRHHVPSPEGKVSYNEFPTCSVPSSHPGVRPSWILHFLGLSAHLYRHFPFNFPLVYSFHYVMCLAWPNCF